MKRFALFLLTISIPLIAAPGDTSVCRWHECRVAAFTATYDDMPQSGWFSLVHGFAPLHRKYEIKGSVAVVTGAKFPEGHGWADLKAIFDEGWLDPMSHTHTHPRLTALSDEKVLSELTTSKQVLLEQTGRNVQTLAYPFGNYDERIAELAAGLFIGARSFRPGWNTFNTSDYYGIQTPWIVAATTPEEVDEWPKKALRDGDWLVTTGHAITEYADGWNPAPLAIYDRSLGAVAELVKNGLVWSDTYTNVTKYLRERNVARVAGKAAGPLAIEVSLTLDPALDPNEYDFPLTLATEVPRSWRTAEVRQGASTATVPIQHGRGPSRIVYRASPDGEKIVIEGMR